MVPNCTPEQKVSNQSNPTIICIFSSIFFGDLLLRNINTCNELLSQTNCSAELEWESSI